MTDDGEMEFTDESRRNLLLLVCGFIMNFFYLQQTGPAVPSSSLEQRFAPK